MGAHGEREPRPTGRPRQQATPTTRCSTTPPPSSPTVAVPFLLEGWRPVSRGHRDERGARPTLLRDAVDGTPARARPGARRRLPGPHADRDHDVPAAGRAAGRPRASRASGWSARSTSGRPSATGWSGSATRPSSTRPSPAGRCGGCASSTPSACPSPLLESALRTHPHVVDHRRAGRPNPHFTAPADYLRALPVPAEPLEDTPPRLPAHDVADFIGLRHAVAAELATVAAPRDLVEDFLLAVDEMTSNALAPRPAARSACGCGSARDRIVCTIGDRGRAGTTRSPVTARRTARTCPAAAWACGWPASSATTSTSPATPTAPASGSPSASASRRPQPNRSPRKDSFFRCRWPYSDCWCELDFEPCTCRSTSPTTPLEAGA